MKLIQKIITFLCLLVCCSCENSTYLGSDTYKAFHLINAYVDTNAPQLRSSFDIGEIFRIDIEFNSDNADLYYSKEFADVSKKNQSEEQLRKFINLANKNNDILQWEPWYETFGGSQKKQTYHTGGTFYALAKGIRQIEIVSDADFDEKHPAGVSLMDYVTLTIDTYSDLMGATSLPNDVIYDTRQTKAYKEYTAEELSVVGTWWILKLAASPSLSKNHNLTVTITFDDGEVYSDTVEVKF
ncbi:MAG: DUF5034 domain-containing protein [Rikenellaceae bacterium]|nr:DUF5034 domain-containing protein [Rikenellaceae bacterium]